MGTTVKDILSAARAKIALIPTSRAVGEFYLEHKTSEPFEKSPISKRDGFECTAIEQALTHAFGVDSEKEGVFKLIVKLGHAPFGTDDQRENYLQQDVARLADLLEAFAWPTGTRIVLFEHAETAKQQANWWVTTMKFQVVYTGAIETA